MWIFSNLCDRVYRNVCERVAEHCLCSDTFNGPQSCLLMTSEKNVTWQDQTDRLSVGVSLVLILKSCLFWFKGAVKLRLKKPLIINYMVEFTSTEPKASATPDRANFLRCSWKNPTEAEIMGTKQTRSFCNRSPAYLQSLKKHNECNFFSKAAFMSVCSILRVE